MTKLVKGDQLVICVAEDSKLFFEQVTRWFTSLTVLAKVPASHLGIAFVGAERPPSWSERFETAGALVKVVPRFDERSPHCNKISGLVGFSELELHRMVVCDCDLAFLENPCTFPIERGVVSAKPVDRANPPNEILDVILRKAGLSRPERVRLQARPWRRTYEGNVNGGLLIIEGTDAKNLGEAWTRWARWLLERIELLDRWAIHVDQVAFFLTLVERKMPFTPLGAEYNFPTHRPNRLFFKKPIGLHYHNKVDRNGALLHVGQRAVDRQIDRVNDAFAKDSARVRDA